MAYHPLPASELLELGGVRFEIRYADSFVNLGNPNIDEAHIHNSYEIYVNVQGDVSFLVENRLYPIRSGDVVITRPGEMHLCIYHRACIHEHFCLWITIPENSALLSFINRPGFCNLYSPSDEARREIMALLKRLNRLELQKGRELERTICFLRLIFQLDQHTESPPKSWDAMPDELQHILDYINENFREIHHIQEIFDAFFTSPSTMNRWFRKYIHLSPRKFLESKKLACAQQLLARDLTVSQVCLQCGFSDYSHFIAVFKKKFGETPYQYKMNSKTSV